MSPPANGAWLDPGNVTHCSREAFSACAYEWVTSHVFRKTVATVLDEANLATMAIADQLGKLPRSSSSTTASAESPTERPVARWKPCSMMTTNDKQTGEFVETPTAVVRDDRFRTPVTWDFAPRTGLEPVTLRLTAECSAIELPGIGARRPRWPVL